MAETDPLFNDPPPVTIGGREWVCRELPWPIARRYIRRLYQELGEYRAGRPSVAEPTVVEAVTTGDPDAGTEEPFMDLVRASLPDLVERASGLVAEMIAESTRVSKEGIETLPTSVFFELTGHVLEAQVPAVRAFLALRAKAEKVLAVARNGSGQPASSPASPPVASVPLSASSG